MGGVTILTIRCFRFHHIFLVHTFDSVSLNIHLVAARWLFKSADLDLVLKKGFLFTAEVYMLT